MVKWQKDQEHTDEHPRKLKMASGFCSNSWARKKRSTPSQRQMTNSPASMYVLLSCLSSGETRMIADALCVRRRSSCNLGVLHVNMSLPSRVFVWTYHDIERTLALCNMLLLKSGLSSRVICREDFWRTGQIFTVLSS